MHGGEFIVRGEGSGSLPVFYYRLLHLKYEAPGYVGVEPLTSQLFMPKIGRTADVIITLLVGLLVVQQLPTGTGMLGADRSCPRHEMSCTDQTCDCDCSQCRRSRRSRVSSDLSSSSGSSFSEPVVVPCGTSSEMPLIMFSVDHMLPVEASIRERIVPRAVRIGDCPDLYSQLLTSEIFRPPQLRRS
jgi:hypothetical protein